MVCCINAQLTIKYFELPRCVKRSLRCIEKEESYDGEIGVAGKQGWEEIGRAHV